jgi:hypothetical protein
MCPQRLMARVLARTGVLPSLGGAGGGGDGMIYTMKERFVLPNRWCTLTCKYIREFSKKFLLTLILFSGAWGKMVHEKS